MDHKIKSNERKKNMMISIFISTEFESTRANRTKFEQLKTKNQSTRKRVKIKPKILKKTVKSSFWNADTTTMSLEIQLKLWTNKKMKKKKPQSVWWIILRSILNKHMNNTENERTESIRCDFGDLWIHSMIICIFLNSPRI